MIATEFLFATNNEFNMSLSCLFLIERLISIIVEILKRYMLSVSVCRCLTDLWLQNSATVHVSHSYNFGDYISIRGRDEYGR